jgi:hypothetical protein
MATRSTIARKNKDGSYTGIYCHWDGYPSNNGKVLFDHYKTDEKIDSLIALGNISSLGGGVTTCIAHHRDRGEDLLIYTGESLLDISNKIDQEYVYAWIDGKWEVWNGDTMLGVSIEDAIKIEYGI